jgi:hypothetical protein
MPRANIQQLRPVPNVPPLRSVQVVPIVSGFKNTNSYFGSLEIRDRRRYLHWVFEAKKRFGLCVLDYAITSNHYIF